jgi:C4-dicarboxylate-specific signal transduction histidine kinase
MDSSLRQSLFDFARLAARIAQCPVVSIELAWRDVANERQDIAVSFPEDKSILSEIREQLAISCAEPALELRGRVILASKIPIQFEPEQSACLDLICRQIVDRIQRDQTHTSQQKLVSQAARISALGEMAAGIAHEINNPLAIIQGNLNKMRTLLENGILEPAVLHESVAVATKTVARIGKIVSGLRSFARDGEGDPFRSVELIKIIEETLSFCQARFSNHNIKIQIQPFSRDLQIECREVQISQVILNLLVNAFDAVEQVENRWVELNCVDSGELIEIWVTDSGVGVAGPVREKMFQPFFTTKPIDKGTGLGLSISKGIVESHGGTLALDIQCANTRFVVRVPKKQKSGAALC